jgi:hypothetical protein
MNDLFIYLLKASLATAALYLMYLLFFRKDTFYVRNRVFLILVMILPFIIPALRFSVVNEIESTGTQVLSTDGIVTVESVVEQPMPVASHSLNYGRILIAGYWVVTIILILRLVIRVISTHRVIKKGIVKQDKFPKVIETDSDLPPFSFFPYAVIPSGVIQSGNYSDLLEHECAHIRQGHTFDLLLCELIIAFQWFNPMTWLMKRSVTLNNEYLADQASLRNNGSVKEYQYRLLNFQSNVKTCSLAHSFNRSIKERIIMINKRPTARIAILKNILIIPVIAGLLFACTTKMNSKTIIINPSYQISQPSYLRISKIELSEASTVLHFHVTYTPGWWIRIQPETQIISGNDSYPIVKTEGIPLGKSHYMPESGEMDFILIFPGIPGNVDEVDFMGSGWYIKGIKLTPDRISSSVPESFAGNWYCCSTGAWGLSLSGDQVAYKEKLWSYDSVDFKNRKGSVILQSGESTVHLHLRKKGQRLFVGESPEEIIEYCKDKSLTTNAGINNDAPFSDPVFQEETTIYSGFIKGYKPEISGSSFVLTFKNIISGNNYYYIIDVNANGSFSREIPLLYPQIARIRSKAYQGSVFLEPGKKMFQMIDPGTNESEYAGESAGINYDLDKLRNINSFNYNEMRQTINNMSPEQYKSYCLDNLRKDINTLDSLKEELQICTRAYQMARMNMEYIYASHILDYDWYYRSAYKEQQNLNTPVMEIPLEVESLTAGYYDFLTDDLLNNPVGIYSDNYNAFIHSFKNIAIVQPTGDYTIQSGNHPMIDFLINLTIAGVQITKEESELFNDLDLTELQDIVKSYAKFLNDHEGRIHEFFGKHIEIARYFNPGENGKMSLFSDVIDYMKENRIDFTDEEKVLVDAYNDFETAEIDARYREFFKRWGRVLESFPWDYKYTYNVNHYVAGALKRKENFQNELGIGPCMATDAMLAQYLYAPIYMDTQNHLTEDQKSSLLKYFSTRYITDYFNHFLEDRFLNAGIKWE